MCFSITNKNQKTENVQTQKKNFYDFFCDPPFYKNSTFHQNKIQDAFQYFFKYFFRIPHQISYRLEPKMLKFGEKMKVLEQKKDYHISLRNFIKFADFKLP
jgi:hypothetical protein